MEQVLGRSVRWTWLVFKIFRIFRFLSYIKCLISHGLFLKVYGFYIILIPTSLDTSWLEPLSFGIWTIYDDKLQLLIMLLIIIKEFRLRLANNCSDTSND